MRKRLIFTAVAVGALGFILYWLSTISFIEISVDTQGSGTLSYQLHGQGSQKDTKLDSSATTIKKRVSKGSYEVLVKQGDSSYFAVAKTAGFFRKTVVSGSLSPEKSRRFIGDNPEGCMQRVEVVLVSYACGDRFSNVKIHVPASISLPTYTRTNPDNAELNGYVEGIVKTSEGSLVLVHWPSDGEAPSQHFIYRVNANMDILSQMRMSALDGEKSYSINSYKDGFIVYDSSFDHVLYYASTSSTPVDVTLDKPSTPGLTPLTLDSQGDKVLALYATGADTDPKKARAEVIVYENNRSSRYVFKKGFSSARFCDDSGVRLCIVGSKALEVYSIDGAKPVFQYALDGVVTIERSTRGLLVVREREVLSIDTKQRNGFVEYSLGEYLFNKIRYDINGYILNLKSNSGKKVALYIDQQTNNADSIDKKVEELRKLPEVSDVSAYGAYIFVSPNLGALAYSDELEIYTYDPGVVQNANNKINEAITNLVIDRNVYTVINTSQ